MVTLHNAFNIHRVVNRIIGALIENISTFFTGRNQNAVTGSTAGTN